MVPKPESANWCNKPGSKQVDRTTANRSAAGPCSAPFQPHQPNFSFFYFTFFYLIHRVDALHKLQHLFLSLRAIILPVITSELVADVNLSLLPFCLRRSISPCPYQGNLKQTCLCKTEQPSGSTSRSSPRKGTSSSCSARRPSSARLSGPCWTRTRTSARLRLAGVSFKRLGKFPQASSA